MGVEFPANTAVPFDVPTDPNSIIDAAQVFVRIENVNLDMVLTEIPMAIEATVCSSN